MGHNGTNHGLFSVNPAQVYKARQAEEERGGGREQGNSWMNKLQKTYV